MTKLQAYDLGIPKHVHGTLGAHIHSSVSPVSIMIAVAHVFSSLGFGFALRSAVTVDWRLFRSPALTRSNSFVAF